MKYKGAAIQYDCHFMDKEKNLADLTNLVRQAAEQGAKLIVLPEMCATGYYFDSMEQAAEMAEPIANGQTVRLLENLAKELDCYLVAGLPESDGERLYNSAVLIGPEGLIGRHRKMHHYVPDSTWAKTGDEPVKVFNTPIGNIGIQICMDLSYPEGPRLSRLMGAQVLCSPMNWNESSIPSDIWLTRAKENGMYVIASNRHGNEKGFDFCGGSGIIDPEGRVVACHPYGDGIAMAEIDLEMKPDRSEIPLRRPKLYRELQLQRYPWYQSQYYQAYATEPLLEGKQFSTAVCSMKPENREEGFMAVKQAISQAGKQGERLLVLPELVLGGVPDDLQQAQCMAIREDDPVWKELSSLVMENHVDVILGFVLEENGKLWNAAACLCEDGSRHYYRKSHLTEREAQWAEAGDCAGLVLDRPYGRIGVLLGNEIFITEVPRLLANSGCDILAVPAVENPSCPPGIPEVQQEVEHYHLARVRANENSTYAAFAAQKGVSGIFGPDMFLVPRNEVVLNESGFADMTMDTRFIFSDESGCPVINLVREKPMLGTRHTTWYDKLIEETDCVL